MRIYCIECGMFLNRDVFNYSTSNFGMPLCYEHQYWFKNVKSTAETRELYTALKLRGVPAKLEQFDGFKHIDIAVPDAKVNIEVDGVHHATDYYQAMRDLKRTYHSFLKGYFTLRIPNTLIQNNIQETADYIVDILNEANYRNWEKW